MEKVELFENQNIDVLRYQRDYPKILQLKDSYLQTSPDTLYSAVNGYDQICNDIVVSFRQQGEADTMLADIIATRQAISRIPCLRVADADGSQEEEYFMSLLLSQLISDNSGPGLIKAVLDQKDLNYLRTLPLRPDHPFR